MASTLVLNESYYNESNCSFDDLQVAVNKLSLTSEEEFNSIKNEKWFTRVFDMVTFSNKKDIRLATQIQNVVQAQEILIQILVRLSTRDQQLNNLVEEAFAKIEKLSEQDVVLAETIKKLEAQFYFGISNEATLETLTENEKYVLGSVLLALADCYETTSEAQKEYADFILSYLNVQEAEIDYRQALSNVTNLDKKKLLLQIGLEYVFLHKGNLEINGAINEIIMEFDFGQKTIDAVLDKIQGVFKLRGVDGFFNRLNIESLDKEFKIESGDFVEPQINLNEVDLEEIIFSKIISVKPGEHLLIENKLVEIRTFFNIEGEITFKNCIINYAEENTSYCITLSGESSINFVNCEIVNKGDNEQFFIEGQGENTYTFENCNLIGCGKFLKVTCSYEVIMKNCILLNPKKLLIHSNATVKGKLSLFSSKIMFTNSEGHMPKRIFNLASPILIRDSYFEGVKDIYEEYKSRLLDHEYLDFKTETSIINSPYIEVENSEFKYLERCFYGSTFNSTINIRGSKFKECSAIISNYVYGEIDVDESLFEGGTRLFNSAKYSIKNSVIKNTIGNIFEGYLDTMEFNEFYNLKSSAEDTIIKITVTKDSGKVKITKCSFDGIYLENGFLIAGNTFEKIKDSQIEISSCEFKNAFTMRKSKVILKQFDHYHGLFNRIIETQPLKYNNCAGLEEVILYDSDKELPIMWESKEPKKGVKFGLAAAGIAAVVGSPISLAIGVGYGVSRLLKDDKLTDE